MQAKEMTLEPLLEGQKQYLVPLYQRTYAWQRDQLDRLWNDILAQADALQDGTTSPGHFIGSLVLAPAPNVVAGGVARWLVVDGQQRMTTILLALAALRDHVRSESPQDADRVHRQCLVNEWQTGNDHLKLLPTQTDRPAFEACITGTHKPGGGNIAAAYPSVRAGGEQYWPWTIRPTTGTVEVVFQHLLIRPPFGDTALRDELRRRINRIPGVDLPMSRLELRPSFPIERLVGDAGLNAATDAHAWFLDQLPTTDVAS